MDELAFLPATEQARLVREGQVSPVELVETHLERIERLIGADRHERTELGVEALDPLEVGLDELDRRHLARPDEASLLRRRKKGELVHEPSLRV